MITPIGFGIPYLVIRFVFWESIQDYGFSFGDCKWIAAIVSGVLSALLLIGLPWIFPVSALLSSIPGGFVNFRLQSFFYFAFLHWNMGVWSDIWEIIKLNIANGML